MIDFIGNFDGYANSIFTLTIGAVDEDGNMPYYAEECAAMLAVTFSSGGANTKGIVSQVTSSKTMFDSRVIFSCTKTVF